MGYWTGSGVNAVDRDEDLECSHCGAENEVNVIYEDNEKFWTCPNCGHEHFEYFEVEQDPDYDR